MKTDKIAIVVASNGYRNRTPEHDIPMTPVEIAEDAYRCYDLGASVVHFHGRDKVTHKTTVDLSVYSETIREIRSRGDMLIETTTGVGVAEDPVTGRPKTDPSTGEPLMPTIAERLTMLDIDPPQEMFSVAAGSWNIFVAGFGSMVYQNSPAYLRENVKRLSVRPRTAFQFEIVDVGFIWNIKRLMDEGHLPTDSRKFWLNYILGAGGVPATERHLRMLVEEGAALFPNAPWLVMTGDGQPYKWARLAAEMGCSVLRVGFEDCTTLPDGRPAKTNAEMIKALVDVVHASGREVASTAEARAIFGLND